MVSSRLPRISVGLILLAWSITSLSAFGPTRHHDGEREQGLASWYGSDFDGKPTANGEIFHKDQLTAAHRELPFNTLVRVTNQRNGRSVELRINDRGPWGDGDRIIDVSEAAADLLQMKTAGTIPVVVEVIQLGPPRRHPSD